MSKSMVKYWQDLKKDSQKLKDRKNAVSKGQEKRWLRKTNLIYINERLEFHKTWRELTNLANVLYFKKSINQIYIDEKNLKFRRKQFFDPRYQNRYFEIFQLYLSINDFAQICWWAFMSNVIEIKQFTKNLGLEYDKINQEKQALKKAYE